MILDNVTLVIELSRNNTKLTEVISCLTITLIIIPNKLKIVILLSMIVQV